MFLLYGYVLLWYNNNESYISALFHNAKRCDGLSTGHESFFYYISDTDDVNKLQKIFEDNRSKIEDLIKQISECFNQKDFQQAKYYISKIKYFVNIEDKIKSKTFLH